MSTADMPLHAVRSKAHDLLRELEAVERWIDRSGDAAIVYPQLKKAIDHCLECLKSLEIWGPDNRTPASELWKVAGHLLHRGWLQNQARTKPRGYAGDHELLSRIYDGLVCDDPLGQLFDRYFLEQAAPQAVRNRMALAADWIVHTCSQTSEQVNIAIVGSAFGLEVRDALLRLDDAARRKLHFTLLDLDPAAIECAQSRLAHLLDSDQLTAISTNLFRLADRPQVLARLSQAHLLICPGLFDYLDQAQSLSMLRCLYNQTSPGGALVIFQFAPHNPTRAYMEWFGNWYLIYRTQEQFQNLVHSAALPATEIIFDTEPLGIDLFCRITKS